MVNDMAFGRKVAAVWLWRLFATALRRLIPPAEPGSLRIDRVGQRVVPCLARLTAAGTSTQGGLPGANCCRR
jgi:hypothetical protein